MGHTRVMEVPKPCATCGTMMTRKRFNGVLEDLTTFNRRRYCTLSCANTKPSPGKSAYHKRARACLKNQCERCGTMQKLGVHHKDRDVTNNSPENLQTLCPTCHASLHWEEGKTPWRRHPASCIVCGKPAQRSGFCATHLTRFKRHGNPYLTKKKSGLIWLLVDERTGEAVSG